MNEIIYLKVENISELCYDLYGIPYMADEQRKQKKQEIEFRRKTTTRLD